MELEQTEKNESASDVPVPVLNTFTFKFYHKHTQSLAKTGGGLLLSICDMAAFIRSSDCSITML